MENLWTDFHKNYSHDSKIAPSVYRKAIKPSMSLYNNDNFVNVTTKMGEEKIGSKTISLYESFLYKNTGATDDKGMSVYTQINKKGVPYNFIEATGANTPSIVNKNLLGTPQDSDRQAYSKDKLPTNPTSEVTDVIKDKKC